LLELLQKTPKGLPPEAIKRVIYQILTAVEFLHCSRIIHRDIKPENLLISESGVVKLCDFGFARKLQDKPNYQYTDYVSTRWYRAPELLVGDAAYSTSVDVWAIGCIFAEIFNGLPLFPGQSDLHTL
jgi:cyclin-dependent kinase-like